MLELTLLDMTLVLDFTAPAWGALLSLMLPRPVLLRTLLAGLLHESAHLAVMRLCRQRPESMRISAAGLCLRMRGEALCPLPQHCAVLLAGPLANALAGGICLALGEQPFGYANLSLGMLNLLPFSGTDGGSLLHALLTHALLARAPGRILTVTRAATLLTACLTAGALAAARIGSPPMWTVLLWLTVTGLTR